jgi:alkylated DNA repair dioxygenase AlkB
MNVEENHYVFKPNFLYQKESNYLYSNLLKEIPWRQVKYFKPERGLITTPRMTWVCGFHQNKHYPIHLPQKINPNPFPEWILPLKNLVELECKTTFNFILFSLYRDENDSIAFHSDDEKFLGDNPTIASLSVGFDRLFSLKNKHTKLRKDFILTNGSLFIMRNNCQKDYMHSVPKQKESNSPRISLTFRNALNEAASKNYYKYNLLNTIL